MDFDIAFRTLISNISIQNNDEIKGRYKKITKRLNKSFRNLDNGNRNCLAVGSYGCKSGINKISDLDMLYIFPYSIKKKYQNNQGHFLQSVRSSILVTYPQHNVKVDGQVVIVPFKNQDIEVVPCFEEANGTFTYADNNQGGEWRNCNPRAELKAFKKLNDERNGKLRDIAKMVRVWKDQCSVKMSGFFIDTTVYRFLKNNNTYDGQGYLCYLDMFCSYLSFLRELKVGSNLRAPGSLTTVCISRSNSRKILRALNRCGEAGSMPKYRRSFQLLRSVFGKNFPIPQSETNKSFRDTEEYIDNIYSYDTYCEEGIVLDCKVTQDGFQSRLLREMHLLGLPLRTKNTLDFHVTLSEKLQNLPLEIKWKVTNRGDIAESKDCIRGQILDDEGHLKRREVSRFSGDHIVECYIIHKEKIIASDEILVKII
jgi:hypothetical protein